MLGPSRPVLLDLPRVHLDHELPRRRRRCCARAGAARRGGGGGVGAVADEAAALIGEFDEGFSNRQTWHNAALAAIAVWFEDEELATRARAKGPTGDARAPGPGLRRRRHVVRGRELPSLRAARAAHSRWAGPRRPASTSLADARLAGAPRRRAAGARRSRRCPITPFPRARIRASASRWRSRCTSSSGRSGSRGWATGRPDLLGLARELYAVAAPRRADVRLVPARGRRAPARPGRGREPISPGGRCWRWRRRCRPARRRGARATCCMAGAGARRPAEPRPLRQPRVRPVRRRTRPPRSAASHAARRRRALAARSRHRVLREPRPVLVPLDPRAQCARDSTASPSRPATPAARRSTQRWPARWSWARGRYGDLTRTVVAGPDYLLDVVEFGGAEEHCSSCRGISAAMIDVADARVSWAAGPARRRVRERTSSASPAPRSGRRSCGRPKTEPALTVCISRSTGELLRAQASRRARAAGTGALLSRRARAARPGSWPLSRPPDAPTRPGVSASRRGRSRSTTGGPASTATGRSATGWQIAGAGGHVRLGGPPPDDRRRYRAAHRHEQARASARDRASRRSRARARRHRWTASTPASRWRSTTRTSTAAARSRTRARRSSRPRRWSTGTTTRSTSAVDVMKPDAGRPPRDAPPLRLDNEPDDIHADGIQVYLQPEADGPVYGFRHRARPDEDGADPRVAGVGHRGRCRDGRAAHGSPPRPAIALTLASACPTGARARGDRLGFDLLVNEMRAGPATAAPASSSGAAAAAGSISGATGRTRRAFGCWSSHDGLASRASPPPAASAPKRSSAARRPACPPRCSGPRAAGCGTTDGREYLDFVMALGAVALGYAHPAVTRRRGRGDRAGVVGPLAPVLEEEVAAELRRLMPWVEQVRFLKTGAEAMAAAVRLARRRTGRERVLGCGYHGWLDWCQTGEAPGVPAGTRALYAELPFNDAERTRELIRARRRPPRRGGVRAGHRRGRPTRSGSRCSVRKRARVGALLVVDEIKTVGPARGRRRLRALRHPARSRRDGQGDRQRLSARGGRRPRGGHGRACARTWISSTLATELVSLAAARATLGVIVRTARCPSTSRRVGGRLLDGSRAARRASPERPARGRPALPEMCYLPVSATSRRRGVAVARAARRGLLFKRGAYNFVSLAHDDAAVDEALGSSMHRSTRWHAGSRGSIPARSLGSRQIASTTPVATVAPWSDAYTPGAHACHRENRPSTIWTMWTMKMECWRRRPRERHRSEAARCGARRDVGLGGTDAGARRLGRGSGRQAR